MNFLWLKIVTATLSNNCQKERLHDCVTGNHKIDKKVMIIKLFYPVNILTTLLSKKVFLVVKRS